MIEINTIISARIVPSPNRIAQILDLQGFGPFNPPIKA
jgi:hypothetical protein